MTEPFGVKLLDLGVAKDLLLPSLRDRTATDVVVGTLQVLAPESLKKGARSGAPPAPSFDQWGLGVTLYSVLSGRLPFPNTKPHEIVESIMNSPIEPLELLPRFELSPTPFFVDMVIRRCLEKDPAARYPSMAHLAAALRNAQRGLARVRALAMMEAPTDVTGGPEPSPAFENDPTIKLDD